MMESSVNVTCAEIQITDGFEFRVTADRFTHLHQSDCESLWYSQDDILIADPSDPQKLIDPVISVSSDRLVTSHCVNELRHEILCDSSGFRLDTIFRARNETAVTPNSVTPDLQHSGKLLRFCVSIFIILLISCFHQFMYSVIQLNLLSLTCIDQWWWIYVLLIVIVLLVLICFLRKRIFRCFQRKERFISQREAPDNRDLVTLRSDHPGIGSANQCSVQCPDADKASEVLNDYSPFWFFSKKNKNRFSVPKPSHEDQIY
ncbi:uncharacterized protein LOC122144090 isoform X1 [Cyprinus carpio]|uniref:Uncharacterized protein LOC122144090 isoform X1 n=1 Tax=Cyprinus carpio TaxID=7962 RepID=A0A9R0AW60_CYPCA|nr:uncharacterized protein LOC122144090 isoform X1 [Cyprinus carpio]